MRLFSSGLDGRSGRKRGLGSRLSVSLPTSQAGLVVLRRRLGSYGAGTRVTGSQTQRDPGFWAWWMKRWWGGTCISPRPSSKDHAGQGWPQVGVRGQAVPSARALPADPAGPALPRAAPPQDCSGLGMRAWVPFNGRAVVPPPPLPQPQSPSAQHFHAEMAAAAISSGKRSASLMRTFAYITKNLHRCWGGCPSSLSLSSLPPAATLTCSSGGRHEGLCPLSWGIY